MLQHLPNLCFLPSLHFPEVLMPRFFVLALAAVTLATSISSAETIIPGGNVSGLWNTAGSPYPIIKALIIQELLDIVKNYAYIMDYDQEYAKYRALCNQVMEVI
jgi:hypothetical protein